MRVVKEDDAYRLKREVAVKAFQSGCMIYANNRWYTPREFMDSDIQVVENKIGMQTYYNVTLHHAQAAIERNLEDLRKAQKDYEDFMKRVLTAFEVHPRTPTKKNRA